MADLDENALASISEETGGRFYRGRDAGTIESAFKSIDQTQKIEFEAKSFVLTTELFPWVAAPGFLCVLMGGLVLAWPTLRTRTASPRPPVISRPAVRS
jgi:Ca-activated chloride channel family protein